MWRFIVQRVSHKGCFTLHAHDDHDNCIPEPLQTTMISIIIYYSLTLLGNKISINVESHDIVLMLSLLEGNHHYVLLLSLLCNLEGN